MIRYLLSRIGCLFQITGSILILLGAAAIRSDQPGFDFLFIGLIVVFLGFIFWNRWRSKERRNTRFSKFRKRSRKDDQESQEKDDIWEDRFNE